MSIVARTMLARQDLSRIVASLVLCGSALWAPVYHLRMFLALSSGVSMVAHGEILGAVSESDRQKASLDNAWGARTYCQMRRVTGRRTQSPATRSSVP